MEGSPQQIGEVFVLQKVRVLQQRQQKRSLLHQECSQFIQVYFEAIGLVLDGPGIVHRLLEFGMGPVLRRA